MKKYLELNDITAYKDAFHFSNMVWGIVVGWNHFAQSTIGSQFVRAIDSISANIAEGFGRYSKKDKIKFYRYSLGSLKESLDWNEKAQKELLTELRQYSPEFSRLVENKKFDMENGKFGHHDAPVYYSMIRHFKPKKIIEVGAGSSTELAYLAAQNDGDTSIISIDPFVNEDFKKRMSEHVNFIQKPVQNIPLSLFESLSKNDILFIDSSHVTKIGSDVNFLFLEVLPTLKPEVIVHVHDIFLPRTYSRAWLENHLIFWNEQFLLNAFLIENKSFEVLLANSFMGTTYPESLRSFYDTGKISGGGSFWMRRIK